MEELHKTWDDIAANWHRWGPPLRPQAEDIELTRKILAKWRNGLPHILHHADVFILGVTPELVTMDIPFPNYVVGMDIAKNMVDEVWPGDLSGYRHGVVGDWFNSNYFSDVILADGSFVFFNKEKADELAERASSLLEKDGIMIVRQFVAPTEKQILKEIEFDLRAKKIRNFHELKFRVAMSLQPNSDEGIDQNSIYEAVMDLSWAKENTYFSKSDWITLEFYKGKTAKMHFPTIQEYRALFLKHFDNISVEYPNYDFGHCCPTIVLTKPNK